MKPTDANKNSLDISKYQFSNSIEDIYIAELNSSRAKQGHHQASDSQIPK
jgi:hypothetical protein